MRRRDFIAGLGGAAVLPVALRAQPSRDFHHRLSEQRVAGTIRAAGERISPGSRRDGLCRRPERRRRIPLGEPPERPPPPAKEIGPAAMPGDRRRRHIARMAAKEATNIIPVVFPTVPTRLRAGLVTNLAGRPAHDRHNLSGAEVGPKCLEC